MVLLQLLCLFFVFLFVSVGCSLFAVDCRSMSLVGWLAGVRCCLLLLMMLVLWMLLVIMCVVCRCSSSLFFVGVLAWMGLTAVFVAV